MVFSLDFYKGRRVFITGHTGFKGSWMSMMLVNAGAKVIGYSSCSTLQKRLFDLCGIGEKVTHLKGDVRDLDHLTSELMRYEPEIVIHMAAQPLVRYGYRNPVQTYATNVMGTVNVCEAIRQTPSVKSLLNVTTDKVYENKEWAWGYRENDPLDGYDPYSNSKSCSELVTHSYSRSFLREVGVAVSTARAGNVIGGGDFAQDRLVPDCVRAVIRGDVIRIRNPESIRPYQHVIEPLFAYLMIAAMQYDNPDCSSWYNIGPDERDCASTADVVNAFVRHWGENASWIHDEIEGPHEASFLKLDNSKVKSVFGWCPIWDFDTAVEKTVGWSKAWLRGDDVAAVMIRQVNDYMECWGERR